MLSIVLNNIFWVILEINSQRWPRKNGKDNRDVQWELFKNLMIS